MTANAPPQSDRARRLLGVLRREPIDTTPIWIMRQAGRYLPEYRATRARAGDFLTLCKTPELACEVTLQPVDRLGVDAAILFSDILIPLEAMGIPLTFEEGEGPRLEPVQSETAVEKLRVIVPEESTRFVLDAIRLCRRALDGRVPLIGFAGAPWTLLCYAVEGHTSRGFPEAKRLLFARPDLAHALLEKITATTIAYLRAQIEAGAQVVQLFDSWAGALAVDEYRTFSLPYNERIARALLPLGAPLIHFCNEGAALFDDAATVGDALGVDFRTPIETLRARLGAERVLQGNLDPWALFAPPTEIARRAEAIIARAGKNHIFNLGHGIQPGTPPEHALALVEAVHRAGRRAP